MFITRTLNCKSSNQRRHSRSYQVKKTFAFPTFEEKGRLQAHGNGVKIFLLPGQALQESKSEIATQQKTNQDPATADLAYLIAG